MKSSMDLDKHHEYTQRALELGRAGNPAGLPELIALLDMPSAEIRRLAASAIGKLAGFDADAETAVAALEPLALRDPHPQVQQYALKAVKNYGTAAEGLLNDLDDLAATPRPKDYVRRAAASAATHIREALAHQTVQQVRRCQTCNHPVDLDEYERARRMFERVYCDKCFDETCVKRRNFESRVEDQKTIRVVDGTLVQSKGERQIAEWLANHNIDYRYDGRLRIIQGFQIRPDFYLPEFDVYIEYWGLDTPRYKAGMYVKQDLYMHTGKKLISLYPDDRARLDAVLGDKLMAYGWHPQKHANSKRHQERSSRLQGSPSSQRRRREQSNQPQPSRHEGSPPSQRRRREQSNQPRPDPSTPDNKGVL